MKLYEINYIIGDIEGRAVVSADNPNEASKVLQSEGRNNGLGIYKCNSITEIGCSEHPAKLISDYFTNTLEYKTSNPVEPKPEVPIINIKDLPEKDIKELKARLDNYSRVLFVDRMGTKLRPKALPGYKILITTPDVKDDLDNYTLYVKSEKGYINCGHPLKYNYIESPKKRIYLSKGLYGYKVDRIEYIRPPGRLGLFYLTRRRHGNIIGKRSSNRWKFICYLTKSNEVGINNRLTNIYRRYAINYRTTKLVINDEHVNVWNTVIAVGYCKRARRGSARKVDGITKFIRNIYLKGKPLIKERYLSKIK